MLRYHDHRGSTRVGRMSVGDGSRDGIIVRFVVGRWECAHKPAWDVDRRRGDDIGHHVVVTKSRGWWMCHWRQKGTNRW